MSDRGSQFVARFWKAFWANLGIGWNFSTAFHPQSSGQTERGLTRRLGNTSAILFLSHVVIGLSFCLGQSLLITIHVMLSLVCLRSSVTMVFILKQLHFLQSQVLNFTVEVSHMVLGIDALSDKRKSDVHHRLADDVVVHQNIKLKQSSWVLGLLVHLRLLVKLPSCWTYPEE